jgi:hypothetical protein
MRGHKAALKTPDRKRRQVSEREVFRAVDFVVRMARRYWLRTRDVDGTCAPSDRRHRAFFADRENWFLWQLVSLVEAEDRDQVRLTTDHTRGVLLEETVELVQQWRTRISELGLDDAEGVAEINELFVLEMCEAFGGLGAEIDEDRLRTAITKEVGISSGKSNQGPRESAARLLASAAGTRSGRQTILRAKAWQEGDSPALPLDIERGEDPDSRDSMTNTKSS